jgi:tetratricopeptide (TPR) repeat protein
LLGLKRHEEAIPEVAEIIKNNPEYAEARYLKGFIHSGMGDYDIAIREFNKVIELDPEAGNGTVYHAKGKAELANDMCEEAAVTLSEGLRRDPDNVAMLVLKGASHARMQEPDAAFAHLDKAISLNAELADPYSYKATLLCTSANFFIPLPHLENDEPICCDIWLFGLPLLLSKLAARKFGKHVEAMELIEKALEIDPESRLANVSKVEILMDMQKWKEAFDAVNECIAKFPDTSNLGILKQKIVDESDRPITAIPPLSSSD